MRALALLWAFWVSAGSLVAGWRVAANDIRGVAPEKARDARARSLPVQMQRGQSAKSPMPSPGTASEVANVVFPTEVKSSKVLCRLNDTACNEPVASWRDLSSEELDAVLLANRQRQFFVSNIETIDQLHSPKTMAKHTVQLDVNITGLRKENHQHDFLYSSHMFFERGAMLVKTSATGDTEDDIKTYEKDLRKAILQLYPKATRIQFPDSQSEWLRRGGESTLKPALNAWHLDYFQEKRLVQKFLRYGEQGNPALVFPTDAVTPSVILGVWKPHSMKNPVLDFPLAFMDGSTLDCDKDIIPNIWSSDNGMPGVEVWAINSAFTAGALADAERFRAEKKFFYFHEQTVNDIVLFSHFNRDSKFANVHGAVEVPAKFRDVAKYGEDFESRKSLEARINVYFD